MQNSYLLLDEQLRFLDCSANGKVPSESILEVGVEKALGQAGFDFDMFEVGCVLCFVLHLYLNQKLNRNDQLL
jgi:hypothetical protein